MVLSDLRITCSSLRVHCLRNVQQKEKRCTARQANGWPGLGHRTRNVIGFPAALSRSNFYCS
jgi:hypothetical protein